MEFSRGRDTKTPGLHGLKRHKRLRPKSSRRAAQLKEYARLHDDWLLAHPTCEICKAKRSSQVHHRCGRIGDQLNSTADWIAVCRECHDKIHAHGRWARENGFLK
jgi:hypothetical protein